MYFSVTANNGYRLLTAQGMATLQTFLKEHGSDCIKQFVQVRISSPHITTFNLNLILDFKKHEYPVGCRRT